MLQTRVEHRGGGKNRVRTIVESKYMLSCLVRCTKELICLDKIAGVQRRRLALEFGPTPFNDEIALTDTVLLTLGDQKEVLLDDGVLVEL